MNKKVRVCALCFLLVIIANGNLLAAAGNEQAVLQNHVEKMKFKSPGKYQEMVQRAGGNVTSCLSCHVEFAKQGKKIGR